MTSFNHNLEDIAGRIEAGERISLEEALSLREKVGLLELGRLASIRRRALHEDRATYVRNLHINFTNRCENQCRFCAYRKEEGDGAAFEWTPKEIWDYAERMAPAGVREFHLTGGLNPNLRLEYYETVLRGLKERFPDTHLKALTAVEVAYLSQLHSVSVDQVLTRLIGAGLGSLTGGGAETLSPRVRAEVCPGKLDGEGYLDVHRRAHRLGLRSTATLLFGHVETPRERIEHLCRVRELQDETGGFTAFVPLVFHPAGTALSDLPRASARTVLETIALARIVLDNVPHIKAYWVSLGPKLAQVALAWGADDLDGTVMLERIHHSAGAESPEGVTPETLRRLIREAGFRPVERDSEFGEARDSEEERREKRLSRPILPAWRAASLARPSSSLPPLAPPEDVVSGERRLTMREAGELLREGDLLELGRAAHAVRMRLHPEPVVTYNVDRNINTTNVCLSLCEFCAFGRLPGEQGSWTLSREAIAAKIDELYRVSGFQRSASDGPDANPVPPPQILMQGGLSPELDLAWYEDLFRWMRGRWPDLHIHALSPPEIHHLAQEAGVGWRQVIVRLREAGLDSIPGGGAEILSSRLRRAISPRKCDVADWIGVMRAAHEEGLRTTATMVIGLGETLAERVEHLERLRLLQDETGGFTAFIVWTFQPRNTALGAKMENREHREGAASGAGAHGEAARTKGGAGGAGGHDEAACAKGGAGGAGACEYLRTLAVARLYLDNFENVQASWVTQGRDIAQLALLFGANDLGSTMLEENVVAAAGARFRLSARDLENLTLDLGFKPARRDFYYRVYA